MENISIREVFKRKLLSRLSAGGILDIELEDESLESCIQLAIDTLKQRSDAFYEECFLHLTLKLNQQKYVLPDEVAEVIKVYRRGYARAGAMTGEPFSLAAFNNYILSPTYAGSIGGLVTYDLQAQYLKTASRMFGKYMLFNWEEYSHSFTISETPRAEGEEVILHAFIYKPEDAMLKDKYAGKWLQDWAYAEGLAMLSKARSRFSTLAGPNMTGIQQDGRELFQESEKLKDQLIKDLENLIPSNACVSGLTIGFAG